MHRNSIRIHGEHSLSLSVVLLAAGRGARLREGGFDTPKPCAPFLGSSIAQISLTTFMSAGLTRFKIILGCQAPQVRAHYETIASTLGCDATFVETTHWAQGNGVSALAAAHALGKDNFLLAMADHIFSPAFIGDLLETPPQPREICLAVNRLVDDSVDLEDLTKVRIEAGKVSGIGKDLVVWDGGDTGLFYCTQVLCEGLEHAQANGLYSLSAGVRECASRKAVRAVTIGHEREWIDIDTADDLARATKRVTGWLSGYSRQPSETPI